MYTFPMPRYPRTDAEVEFGRRVGAALREGRTLRGLSGGELAIASSISLDAIRSIESGRVSSPGLWVAARLTDALGMSLDTLIADTLPRSGSADQR